MALGDTKSNRNALAAGFFVNLGLNPLLTFTFNLGVTGLALATVIIKTGSMIYLFWIQNYGAEQPARVIETYKKGLMIGLAISVVFIPVMVFLSPTLLGFFSDNPNIINTGATYLRIDAIAFFAYVVLFISVASLQAVKQPLFPMFLGIARQLVLPATINYFLIVVYGLPMISLFITIVCVVTVSALVSHCYTLRQLNALNQSI